MTDEKGNSRGFGFVSFTTSEEATNAVTEMHLKLINGKPLYVGPAEKRDVRHARLAQRYRLPNMRSQNTQNFPLPNQANSPMGMQQNAGVPGQVGQMPPYYQSQ